MSKTRYNLDLVFANIFFGANFSFYVSLTRNYLDFQQIFMLQVLSGAIFFIPFALFRSSLSASGGATRATYWLSPC